MDKISNFGPCAELLNRKIKKFLEYEQADNAEAEKMFQALKIAAEAIEAYVATQPSERKFEVGKSYLDDSFYEVLTVEKLTAKGVKFKGAYGTSRRWALDQESVEGVYNVHA